MNITYIDGMEYRIRPAEIDDAPALYGISVRAHTASYYDQLIPEILKDEFYAYYAWSAEHETEFTVKMARKIMHPAWHVAVAEQQGRVIGYTIAHSKQAGTLMLRGLFVDPVRHSMGVGSALFELSLTWAVRGESIELAVIENNTVARRLYERYGFVISKTKNEDFFGAKMVYMHRPAD